MQFRTVGVIGSREIKDPELEQLCVGVGKLLPKYFDSMVCGGLYGVMEAVPRGAVSANPNFLTVGFLPTDNIADANPYIKLPIATGIGEARNVLIIKNSDVIIAITGQAGTLSELAFAWKYNKKVFCLVGYGGASENILKIASVKNNENFVPFKSMEELDNLLAQEFSPVVK